MEVPSDAGTTTGLMTAFTEAAQRVSRKKEVVPTILKEKWLRTSDES